MRAPRVVRSLHPRGRREQTCCYPRQDLPESSWPYTLAETILGDWSNQLCLDFNLQSGRVVKRQATTLSGFRGELMNMRTMLRLALLLGGIGMGLWHLKLGVRAGFVARNDEPLSFWIFLLTGPFSTLPASITSFFRPAIGGTWLCCGALISYVAVMTALGPKGDLDASLLTFTRAC